MKHVAFPSIEQFRNIVKTVRDRAKYHGIPTPKLQFYGTVKLHGTNAGIVKDIETGEVWAQSREQLITVEKDNAGFARFVDDNKDFWPNLFDCAATIFGDIKETDHLCIYGEWCGQGIMKGVAINQLPKMFVIFGVKVSPKNVDSEDGNDDTYDRWFTQDQLARLSAHSSIAGGQERRVFFIVQFKQWIISIDFDRPELSQNELGELTLTVEQECPVGKSFGVSGVGEGIVWTYFSGAPDTFAKTSDLRFKVKGEKHSDTKVKTLAAVDVEKINNVRALAETLITDHRLEKMVEKLKTQENLEVDVKNTGTFLKLVGGDVLKEEADTIEASGFDRKDVMPMINQLARQWFLKLVNQF